MAGGVASALLQAARRGTRLSGDTGLFEVDEFWLGQVVDELRPRAMLLAQPLPRPARPLRRARHDRRSLGRRRAPRTTADLVLNADDPTVADLGRARGGDAGRERVLLRRRGRRGRAGRDAARRRRQALPPLRRAVPLRRHLPRPPRPLPLRQLRRAPPGARRWPPPTSCSTASAARAFTLRTPAGERPIALPLPGLYNVYNALAAAALALALGAPLDDVAAGLQAVSPAVRPRRDRAPRAGRDLSILLVKNPAGANEVLRTLALEPGEHDLLAILNDQVADGRDVSWVWDADFERPRRARAARDVQRHARGGDGAAAEVRGRADGADRGRDRPRRGRSTAALADGDGPRCSRCRPTPRCSSCATLLVARGAAGSSFGVSAAGRRTRTCPRSSGTTSSAAPTPRTCRCGASSRPSHAGPVLDVGAGTGRVSLAPRRPGPPGRRARPLDADLLAALRAPRGRPAGRDRRGRRARLRPRRAAVRPDPRADADRPAARRPGRPRAVPAPRARRASRPGGLLAIAIADALETFDEVRCLPPLPDIREIDGVVYASRPVAVTKEPGGAVIDAASARRSTPAGAAPSSEDVITLDHLEPATLEAEGAAAGFRVSRARAIPETDDYVGSTVVMLRG